MGFYVTSDDRLLTLGFYSYCVHPLMGPNEGHGLGRVVREIRADGTWGDIYFIRPNRQAGWHEGNLPYPLYDTSPDEGFVAACNELLADRLATLQWWEDDRARDGFYAIDPEVELKALSYFHRPDGVVVGLWKSQYAALSPDEGATWTPIAVTPTIAECFAKTWGQQTSDGRYAVVYNHSATRRNRFPLVVATSDDGHGFDDMLFIDGEVSPARYRGVHKNIGTQYVRGIAERTGQTPDGDLWVTYSMNKEDLWVTRVPVPVSGSVSSHVDEPFDHIGSLDDLSAWSLHVPRWAPIDVIDDPHSPGNRCLRLRDTDPYEYAVAECAFPPCDRVSIRFRLCIQDCGDEPLEFEVRDARQRRALLLRYSIGMLWADFGPVRVRPVPLALRSWHTVELSVDCAAGQYDFSLDGAPVHRSIPLASAVATVERLTFRTGADRSHVPSAILAGEPELAGEYLQDRPGAEIPRPATTLLLDDVRTAPLAAHI